MRRTTGLLLVCIAFGMAPGAGVAQSKANDGEVGPPKVISIIQEYLKPGQTTTAHQNAEKAYVEAFRSASWPTHYMALTSLSGPARALFITGYPSFEAFEKDTTAMQKDTTLSQKMDEALKGDAEVIGSYNSSVFAFRRDLSYQPGPDVPTMRYVEISRYAVKAGHGHEFEEMAKTYSGNWSKVDPKGHFDVFEEEYGTSGNVYLVFHFMKTLAEVDSGMGDGKKFADAIGADAMKKLADSEAASTESAQTNLFAIDPKMSYVSDAWVKEDPAFWNQK